jgi:hypothetical protein
VLDALLRHADRGTPPDEATPNWDKAPSFLFFCFNFFGPTRSGLIGSFNHLVGEREQRRWNFETERLNNTSRDRKALPRAKEEVRVRDLVSGKYTVDTSGRCTTARASEGCCTAGQQQAQRFVPVYL